ncbi:MAG: hypothetical protein HeimC3_30200 [Candidatus Heimdallarchaeota archaeon LC_3]|nr:MAG: hypothetical protein HeimC3_30200 [Candidatus Heimdallarchaeota archaeon LC_3]
MFDVRNKINSLNYILINLDYIIVLLIMSELKNNKLLAVMVD